MAQGFFHPLILGLYWDGVEDHMWVDKEYVGKASGLKGSLQMQNPICCGWQNEDHVVLDACAVGLLWLVFLIAEVIQAVCGRMLPFCSAA